MKYSIRGRLANAYISCITPDFKKIIKFKEAFEGIPRIEVGGGNVLDSWYAAMLNMNTVNFIQAANRDMVLMERHITNNSNTGDLDHVEE